MFRNPRRPDAAVASNEQRKCHAHPSPSTDCQFHRAQKERKGNSPPGHNVQPRAIPHTRCASAHSVGGTTIPAGAHWLISDHEGSVRRVINSGGGSLGDVAYDSFGNVTIASGTQLPAVATTPAKAGSLFGYAGSVYDVTTGLSYMNARYYDPASGRFLSEDPLGFAAGDTNLYRYVGNNPVNATDPTGLATSYLGGNYNQIGASFQSPFLAELSGQSYSPRYGGSVNYNSGGNYASSSPYLATAYADNSGYGNGGSSALPTQFADTYSLYNSGGSNGWGGVPGSTVAAALGEPINLNGPYDDGIRNIIHNDFNKPDVILHAAISTLENPRVQGALQVTGAIASGAAAAALAAVPDVTITKVAAGVLGLSTVDNLWAGSRQIWTGAATPTVTQQGVAAGLTRVGVSPETANTVGGLTNFGIQFGGTLGATAYLSGVQAVAAQNGINAARNVMGLTREQAAALNYRLSQIPGATDVRVFGSRTTGVANVGSDLDIAVFGDIVHSDAATLQAVRAAQSYARQINLGNGRQYPLDINTWQSPAGMRQSFLSNPQYDPTRGLPNLKKLE